MCGLQTGVMRFYTDCKGSKQEVAEMFGSAITFVTIVSVLLSGLLVITHAIWIDWVFSSIPFIPIVLLAILISAVVAIYTVYQEFLKGSHQAKKSVILSYVFFFLLFGCNLLTIIVLKWGAKGVLLSTVVANLIMICYMAIDLKWRGMLYVGIKKVLLKSMLRYSMPLVPHALSYNVSNLFTRVVINDKVNTFTLGLYSLASQFGGIADIVSNSVQSAFQPWFYEKMRQSEDNHRIASIEIRRLTINLLWLIGFIYLMIGTWAQEAIDIMSQDSYHSSWQYVPYLVMAVAIKSPLYFYQNVYYYHKDMTRYIFMFTLAGCLSSMFFVWLLVPEWGIYGAIVADIVGVVVRVSCTLLHGKKIISHTYSIGQLLMFTIATIAWLGVTVLPSYTGWLSGVSNYIYKTLCILIYISSFMIYHRRGASMNQK